MSHNSSNYAFSTQVKNLKFHSCIELGIIMTVEVGEPHGFGFVQFMDPQGAAKAQYHMDG